MRIAQKEYKQLEYHGKRTIKLQYTQEREQNVDQAFHQNNLHRFIAENMGMLSALWYTPTDSDIYSQFIFKCEKRSKLRSVINIYQTNVKYNLGRQSEIWRFWKRWGKTYGHTPYGVSLDYTEVGYHSKLNTISTMTGFL